MPVDETHETEATACVVNSLYHLQLSLVDHPAMPIYDLPNDLKFFMGGGHSSKCHVCLCLDLSKAYVVTWAGNNLPMLYYAMSMKGDQLKTQ